MASLTKFGSRLGRNSRDDRPGDRVGGLGIRARDSRDLVCGSRISLLCSNGNNGRVRRRSVSPPAPAPAPAAAGPGGLAAVAQTPGGLRGGGDGVVIIAGGCGVHT